MLFVTKLLCHSLISFSTNLAKIKHVNGLPVLAVGEVQHHGGLWSHCAAAAA